MCRAWASGVSVTNQTHRACGVVLFVALSRNTLHPPPAHKTLSFDLRLSALTNATKRFRMHRSYFICATNQSRSHLSRPTAGGLHPPSTARPSGCRPPPPRSASPSPSALRHPPASCPATPPMRTRQRRCCLRSQRLHACPTTQRLHETPTTRHSAAAAVGRSTNTQSAGAPGAPLAQVWPGPTSCSLKCLPYSLCIVYT